MRRRDQNTLDIFRDYTPPEIVARMEPEVVGRGSLDLRISRVVAEAMAQSGKTRAQIAADMSDFLGFPADAQGRRPNGAVTENMLDCYASQARRDHRITLERFIALIEATGCMSALGFVADMFDQIVAPKQYGAVIKLHQINEIKERIAREEQALNAEMRGWR